MAGSILGNEVLRVEDPEIVLGRGIYTGDLKPEGLLYVAFARSSIAHGDILSIDTSEAEGMPGVVKVYTADNLDVPPFQMVFAVADPLDRHALAKDRVRFVGEAVAAVVAETPEQAVDAAEAIFADIDFREAVTDIEATTSPDAPVINETLGKNVVFGNYDPTDPLDDADVVVKARLSNQRVAAAPMENQVLMALPPQNGQPLTVYAASQGVHWVQGMVKGIFGLESDQVRVITPLVGGAFGAKFSLPHEGAVAIKAAMDLDRPVQWVETRSENFTGLPHGRAQVQWVEMGFRKDGTITGLRCHVLGDGGAYGGFGGTLFSSTKMMSSGVYQIPKISFSAAMVLTNTTPTGAYRGAGRPEATALLERLLAPQPSQAHVPLNIHAVLERVLRLAESEAGWAVKLVRDYDPSLPEVEGDPDRLTQALWNLVRNAIEAGAASVHLRTRAEHGVRIGDEAHALALRLEIADDGRGVPDDLTERLFLPLVSGRAEGTGLGLALAQQVAREHRGSLTYRSRVGHTVFTVLLPVRLPVAEAEALMRTFDEPRQVGQHEFAAVDRDDAEARMQRRERIVRDLRFCGRDDREEGRFAGIGQADQAGVGDQLQPQDDRALLAGLARIGAARRAVGRGFEVLVAKPAVAASRDHHALADLRQVGDQSLVVLLKYLRASGHFEDGVRAASARALPAHAMPAGLGLEMLLVAVVYERVEAFDAERHDITAAPAVAAVRAAELDEFLSPEGDAARAAVAGADVDASFVEEFHGSVYRTEAARASRSRRRGPPGCSRALLRCPWAARPA